jgi:outer membrane receptor protein involved in Fe transport
MNHKKIFKRRALAIAINSAVMLAASIGGIAYAQEDEEIDLEEVVVTGSRIQRPEFTQSAPVVSITQAEIQRFATPDLGVILSELPAIGATGTLTGNTAAAGGGNSLAGVSSVDLRRLGLNRTLVLVDGRRHVAAVGGSAQVDISTIPAALVERIDVVTGGASAVYGSDAVSGVVNVILKDDFEGLEFNFSGADSLESVGNQNYSASLVGGFNFADDRGNITMFGGVDDLEQTFATDIRQFNSFGTIVNPNDTGENDGIPDRLRVPNVGSERINAHTVINPFGGPAGIITFDRDGNPLDQQQRDGTNSFAFGNFPNGCDTCFFGETSEDFQPEVEKTYVGANVDFDITDSLNVYGGFKYVETDVIQLFQPIFRFGGESINVVDNPFLDEVTRQRLLGAGQQRATISRFFDDLGFRFADNKRELTQFVTGVKGDFDIGENNFKFDVSYVNGETENVRNTPNDLIEDNFTAALDAVRDPTSGAIVCRDPSVASVNPGACAPFNPFGLNQASAEAQDFIGATTTREDVLKQEVLTASLVSDTSSFINLPGGPIDYVVGFEYREESSATITDALTQSGVLAGAATPNDFGEFDVTEFFAEVSLPLLKDRKFAHELTIGAAYRDADYSHAGSADAWKIDLVWAPFESFNFRGTIGEAVRAPNIDEAFSSRSPGFSNINDPCDADNIGDNPNRAANCAALGIPSGFQANDNVSIDIISGGNPELFSETSDSFTFGFVWHPTFAEGLSMTVDYYDIEINDAILFVDPQDILDNCVGAATGLDAGFCSQISRNASTNDVDLVESGFLNASALTTSGYDVNLDYRGIELGRLGLPGTLDLNVFFNFLTELDRFEFQTLPDEVNVEDGEIGDPDFQYRFTAAYRLNDLGVTWTTRFVERSFLLDLSPEAQGGDIEEDSNIPFVSSQTTHDISANYLFNDKFSIYGGIRNVFDQVPPGYVNNPLYDIVGRRAFFGVRAKF